MTTLTFSKCLYCSMHLQRMLDSSWSQSRVGVSDGQIWTSSLLNLPFKSVWCSLHARRCPGIISNVFQINLFKKEWKKQTIRMHMGLVIPVPGSYASSSPFLEDLCNAAYRRAHLEIATEAVFANSSWIKCQSAQRTLSQRADIRQCWWRSRSAPWLTGCWDPAFGPDYFKVLFHLETLHYGNNVQQQDLCYVFSLGN